MTRSFFRVHLPVLILLAGGALMAKWLGERAARETRADMIQKVQLLAQGMNPRDFKAFAGTTADETKPEYRRVKRQLQAVRSAYPNCRFIYVAGRKTDGSIYFFVDSEPPETKDSSPPGQPYPESSEAFRRVFDTKRATTEGPLPDRWGVWVSALAPITDTPTGAVLAVLGMDIDARLWDWRLARAALPAILLTLALVVIWIVGAVLMERRSRLAREAPAWMRHVEPGLVVTVGLTLSLAATWLAYTNTSRHQAELFGNLADHQAGVFVERLQNVRDLQLEGLGRYYMTRNYVTTEEFQAFTRSLTRSVSVTTWGWIPVVPAADRERFEAAARADGLPNFEIWELDAKGSRVRAADRAVYYPVFQVAPGARIGRVVGNDSGAEPRRRAALEEAMATHLTAGTEPVTLSSETGDQKGLVIYRPVYSLDDGQRLRGFVGASLRLENFLRFGVTPDRISLVELSLLHQDGASESLATTWDPAHPPDSGRFLSRPLFAFGKVFTVTVHAGPEFGPAGPRWAGGLALSCGLVFTGTLATLARQILRRREKLEQLVAERTAELQLSEESYRNQFANSSAVMLLINPMDGTIIDANTAALAFYGYSRERLLAMRVSDINIQAPAEIQQVMESVLQGRRNRFELQHRLADGSIRDVTVSSSRIQYGGRTILHSIIQDITEQKRAQDAQRESAERFRSIISVSNTGAWEYRSDSQYQWCSPEYFSMLGLSEADFDLSGRPNLPEIWVNLLHPDDRQSAADHFAEYLRNGSVGMYENYFRMRHRNGDWIWVWSRGQTLRDASGQPTRLTIGTHIDITERKNAEAALRASEERYRLIAENTSDVIWLYDQVADRFSYASPSSLPLLGYQPEEIVGRKILDLVAPTSLDAARRALDQALHSATGTRAPVHLAVELDQQRKDGRLVPTEVVTSVLTDSAGRVTHILGVTRDITERRQAREALEKFNTQLEHQVETRTAELAARNQEIEALIESIPDTVLLCDERGELITSHFAQSRESSFPFASLGGGDGLSQQHPVLLEIARELHAVAWASQQAIMLEFDRSINGVNYSIEARATPAGEDRLLILLRDISARKRIERDMQANLERERQLSEMKSQFVSVASHEFRTPLAAATGSLELLERHSSRITEAKRVELLTRAQRSLGRLTTIMDNVLQLSRADSGRVKMKRLAVDLVQFVQDIIREVEAGDRQQHGFSFQHSGGGDAVPIDTNLLNHILSNLLGNAVRYSPAGTRITVTLEIGGAAFALTVADEGIGIPEAERDRVFEPFARGSNVGQISGTGLGLNIVKRYTELLGGRIELLRTERGAAFHVSLPVVQPEKPA